MRATGTTYATPVDDQVVPFMNHRTDRAHRLQLIAPH
jgi:hypothetical protein